MTRPRAPLAPLACVAALVAVLASLACPGQAASLTRLPAMRVPVASATDPSADPLVPMLHRLNTYFRTHESRGVTMDSRYPINPSEAIRMGVVCQLLGYTELAKIRPGTRFEIPIRSRADFLAARLDSVRSNSPFDGMLAYSLVQAFEATGDSSYDRAAAIMLAELEAIPTAECILNGGLMVAMATADWGHVTGDPVAIGKTADILAQLPPYQNPDGSFPHWCTGSEDIHYTGWMGEELVLLGRMTGDPFIEGTLSRMKTFLEARLDSSGESSYEGPCPGVPGCVRYYDSQHSGCWYDYDTRDWTVEPAYTAQVMDHFRSATYRPVMGFLLTLENGGTFPDKYGYIPPPSDPEYPWSIADTSVANMSINFWVLATTLTGRGPVVTDLDNWLDVPDDPVAVAGPPIAGPPEIIGPPSLKPPPAGTLVVRPGPASGSSAVVFTLAARGGARLAVFDAAGRRVRALFDGSLEAGAHEIDWDGRDAAGAWCRAGVYFVRLEAGGAARTRRLVNVR